jgi:hypothetical protein
MAFARIPEARLPLCSHGYRGVVLRRCRIRITLRTACLLDPKRAFVEALRRFGSLLAPATSYTAAWSLPWPDSHRLVEYSFQDTRNRKRLVLGLWHVHPRFLPGLTPRLTEMDIPSEPAPSLHPHPSEQVLHRYYEPVRQRAPRPVLNAFGFCLGTLPLATLGPTTPDDTFDARLLTFRARAADQAHAASTPDTTWPRTRAPARLISKEK